MKWLESPNRDMNRDNVSRFRADIEGHPLIAKLEKGKVASTQV